MNKGITRQGFTIVELLIVVVVIGILAAITIVAYNGITKKAKTASAQSAASTLQTKVEAYYAENGVYPKTTGALTSAASTASYFVTSITFAYSTLSIAPTTPNTLVLSKCDAVDGTTGGAGNQISYWNYAANNAVAITTGTGGFCTIATAT